MGPEIIFKYFPELTDSQIEKIEMLSELYHFWNGKINVISRKDIDQLYLHHVLHSLSIARFIRFAPGTRILDAGTGGGFPGIPLAILFPYCHFHLADSISKKIKVVNEISASLKLINIDSQAERLEKIDVKVDFAVSRAVTRFPEMVQLVRKNIVKSQKNSIPNGIIYLKGEDTKDDTKQFGSRLKLVSLKNYFEEDYFSTKMLLYLRD